MIHITDKSLCCGCTACAMACPQRCITMVRDESGFDYPVVEGQACTDCGRCERVCPVLEKRPATGQRTAAYAALDRQESARMQASSGGVFGLLAEQVILRGGLVFGAAYDEKFQVRHLGADTMADVEALKRAKYVQSELGQTFPEVRETLEGGREVLFSGTPCQVSGLKAFLGKPYENLLTVDLVCHAVPSPKAWSEYLHYRMREDGQNSPPAEINLRDKCSGWSQYGYSVRFRYPSGECYMAPNHEDPYLRAMLLGKTVRPSCSVCRFRGYERSSDLTLGDFWGVWNACPAMDDNRGTSLVLTNSGQGEAQLHALTGRLRLEPVSLEAASGENVRILHSQPYNPESEGFLAHPDWDAVRREAAGQEGRRSGRSTVFQRLLRIIRR